MPHGTNYSNGRKRFSETYASVVTSEKKRQSENHARLPYYNHNRFRLSHNNFVHKSMHPTAGQDSTSTTISEIRKYLLLLFDKI